jgi:hypothetical protein
VGKLRNGIPYEIQRMYKSRWGNEVLNDLKRLKVKDGTYFVTEKRPGKN